MGAWIETYINTPDPTARQSHPVWVRGLKHFGSDVSNSLFKVAPCMGAWIETFIRFSIHAKYLSHPVWVRGLKLCGISLKTLPVACRTLYGCVD